MRTPVTTKVVWEGELRSTFGDGVYVLVDGKPDEHGELDRWWNRRTLSREEIVDQFEGRRVRVTIEEIPDLSGCENESRLRAESFDRV
jgi:hypothetical protein